MRAVITLLLTLFFLNIKHSFRVRQSDQKQMRAFFVSNFSTYQKQERVP